MNKYIQQGILKTETIDGKKHLTVKLSFNWLVAIAYLYMLIPTLIFFFGWLKVLFAIPFSALLICGFVLILKTEYKEREYFQIDLFALLLLLIVAGIWVYTSGVGGFWQQRADWHWRNAVLRDLIDYSWPVVYPETGNALVYYFNFFLPPALIGKLFGWDTANIFICFFTWVGVCISMLLLCKILKIFKIKAALILAIIFVVWYGMEGVRQTLFDLLGLNGIIGYQYSSNNTLLQWVTNQTIVPWIAVPLFLDKKKISTYIFLGMCVLTSAPFPFVGIFVFLAVDGIYQFCTNYRRNVKIWLHDFLSIPNLCALSSLIVYLPFYSCNTASNGSSGIGGFGLYVPLSLFNMKNFVSLSSFLLFNFIIYAVLIYKENKRDHIYWIMNISLLLIPIFRLGTSNDFGMRVCIPSQFVLMIYTIKFFLKNYSQPISVRPVLMIGCMAIATLDFYNAFIPRLVTKINAESSNALWADGIYTFANKINDASYCGSMPINFLCVNPNDTLFFSKFCAEKSESESRKDLKITSKFLADNNFILLSGSYEITPANNNNLFLNFEGDILSVKNETCDITISDSTVSGKYEFYFSTENRVWTFSEETNEIILAYGTGNQVWGTPEIAENQLFTIEHIGDSYLIKWNETYALTYSNNNIFWEEINYSDAQLWKIE